MPSSRGCALPSRPRPRHVWILGFPCAPPRPPWLCLSPNCRVPDLPSMCQPEAPLGSPALPSAQGFHCRGNEPVSGEALRPGPLRVLQRLLAHREAPRCFWNVPGSLQAQGLCDFPQRAAWLPLFGSLFKCPPGQPTPLLKWHTGPSRRPGCPHSSCLPTVSPPSPAGVGVYFFTVDC